MNNYINNINYNDIAMLTKMFRINRDICFLSEVKQFDINGTEITIVYKDDTIYKFTVDEKEKNNWTELYEDWLWNIFYN